MLGEPDQGAQARARHGADALRYFAGNAAFFRIGVLAYNLFVMFRSAVLPADWSRRQLATVRWRLYQTAGKVVWHGNRLWLKVRVSWLELFSIIRARTYAFAFG